MKVDTTPRRMRRSRAEGSRLPPGVVYVGRPSKWGNPFYLGMFAKYTIADAVRDYRAWIEQRGTHLSANNAFGKPPTIAEIRRELRGKDLACWCNLDAPCHADVLLELANAE